jgi:hypothetical protein
MSAAATWDSGLDGDRVWVACSTCGAAINRCADDE